MDTITMRPAIAAASGGSDRLHVFALGDDDRMLHKDGSRWLPSTTDWEPLGGYFTSPPAAVCRSPYQIDVFGLGTDSQMFHKERKGAQWLPSDGGWNPLGGAFNSPPAVVWCRINRLDVFALGGDNRMYHKTLDTPGWLPSSAGWDLLGGSFNSPPAAVSRSTYGTDRLDIFGLGSDNRMFHKEWDGSQWLPPGEAWEALGGAFACQPAVASWDSTRMDIFCVRTDGQMCHKAWEGTRWYPSPLDWEELGGGFDSPPSVVSWGADRLDIFAVGRDKQAYHKAWDGSRWLPSTTGWEALGGAFTCQPAVVSWGPGRIDIFGIGTNSRMYHKAWNGSRWLPSDADWEFLGGWFNPTPGLPPPTRRWRVDVSFSGSTPLGGWIELEADSSGAFTFSGYMHNSGATPIGFSVVLTILTPGRRTYAFATSGKCGGTADEFLGGSSVRDHAWSSSPTYRLTDPSGGAVPNPSPVIAENWADFVQGTVGWNAKAQDLYAQSLVGFVEEAINQLLSQGIRAGASALIALLA
jgi:hypothetical protein